MHFLCNVYHLIEFMLVGHVAFDDNNASRLCDPDAVVVCKIGFCVKRLCHALGQSALIIFAVKSYSLRRNCLLSGSRLRRCLLLLLWLLGLLLLLGRSSRRMFEKSIEPTHFSISF